MKTREYAVELRKLADYLDSRPEFSAGTLFFFVKSGSYVKQYVHISYDNKQEFVEAVKAIGDATKKYTDDPYAKLNVTAKDYPLELSIYRDKVCKKITTYDCESLFSEEEENSLVKEEN